MGVYEGFTTQYKPGMHWQQHQDNHQMVVSAYDPSRDSSPNLPTTSCNNESMNNNFPNSQVRGGNTNNNNTTCRCNTPTNAIGMCYSFKEEYDTVKERYYHRVSSPNNNCQDCTRPRNNNLLFKAEELENEPMFHAAEIISSNYNCNKPHHHYKQLRKEEFCGSIVDSKKEAAILGSLEEGVYKMCAGCGRQISDRFYLYAVDRQWHVSCLQCSQCGRTLDDEVTCFARDGNIYCRKDYQRLFGGNKCTRCKSTISSKELVMRARECVFHLHCFMCVICMTVLTKGDHFGMRDGDVYCRIHYESLPTYPNTPPPNDFSTTNSSYNAAAAPPLPLLPLPSPEFVQQHRVLTPNTFNSRLMDSDKLSHSFYNTAVTTPRPKGRPRKRKPKDLDSLSSSLDMNSDSYLDISFGGPGTPGSMSGSGGSHHQRSKRMRTSFKHHQLRTMKTYFTVNHNPDAKDLKQLSQKTGLAKRVLQVWFQNARAKWRRMMNKQDGGNGGKNIDDKSCSESSGSALDSYHGHSSLSLSAHSPQHYLTNSSSLDCNS